MNISTHAFAAALAVLPTSMSAMAADHQWKTYTNVRFGYSICYPADLLAAQPEADNGDGRVFSAKSGAELRVWGGYNVMEQTADAIVSDLDSPDAVVSYHRAKENWAVISGRENGRVFYAKALLRPNGQDDIDSLHVFRLTYPLDEAKTYEAVVARLATCFRPTG